MRESPRPDRTGDAIKVAVGLAFVVLASPLRDVWAQAVWPWWVPFAVWAGVIGAGFAVTRRRPDGD